MISSALAFVILAAAGDSLTSLDGSGTGAAMPIRNNNPGESQQFSRRLGLDIGLPEEGPLPVMMGASPGTGTNSATTAQQHSEPSGYNTKIPAGLNMMRNRQLALADQSPPASESVKVDVRTGNSLTKSTIWDSDVIYNISASDPSSYQYAALQCYGANRDWWTWGGGSGRPALPAPLPVIGDDGELRSNIIADPDDGKTPVFYFAVKAADPDIAGAGNKRCEMLAAWTEYTYPGKIFKNRVALPRNKTFWYAVKFRANNSLGTNDRQVVLQWLSSKYHQLGPMLSLELFGNVMRLHVVSDFSSNPSTASMRHYIPWTMNGWTPDYWYSVTIRARIDDVNPENGEVAMWFDGRQVLAYVGPLGYSDSPLGDYSKFGIYHWTIGNSWDNTVPTRSTMFKGPLLVLDRPGYTDSIVQSAVR